MPTSSSAFAYRNFYLAKFHFSQSNQSTCPTVMSDRYIALGKGIGYVNILKKWKFNSIKLD